MSRTPTQTTLKDIAAELGISHSTVSRALRGSPLISEKTKALVLRAASERGYVAHAAARIMRGGPSSVIGLVIPNVQADLFSSLTTRIGKLCGDRRLNLLLALSQYDPLVEEAQIRTLRESRVSGILIYPTVELSPGSRDLLGGVPTVQLARKHPSLDTAFVGTEDHKSMETLVRHIIDLGHERIAYIGSLPSMSPGSERLGVFRRTLECLGREVDETLVVTGAPTVDAGADAARDLLARVPRPTALMVGSAPMAEGALDVIQQMGLRVPADLSFSGFGDPSWYRSWGPGITSVSMPIEEVAEKGLALLLDARDAQFAGSPNASPHKALRLASHVVLRGTTGKPSC